jgi:predicted metal-dependent phosphoesterase TrpH
MYKIDLHTHSTNSRDGGITTQQYIDILEQNILDYVAITDHNHTSLAIYLHQKLGDKIIIGEEINTQEGEIIGLFLKQTIPRDMPVTKTIDYIKKQGGIVYVPHPFETVRRGISKDVLERIINDVDIIEVYNGRAVFQNKGPQATTFARIHDKPGTASSDAHGVKGLGCAYASIDKKPTAINLAQQLYTAKLNTQRPALKTLLYPKLNRIKKGWIRD